ncbi:uncharacterized protein STEHIDRAFT_112650 [Stereum hirsutum FP-91666 SS1]|uniref:uncharacterized protein n=1 Tax=Stereum hirsutum (strain FP-91666) TaxID=721885 RepID=UPI0004449E1F|nr:uncharacterized protein STEHIDRAFT_112650 [Stereum hirsutum FP-91666 SS1]EIM84211.1 hypothetical protein STEHIDRAFT_112650 [Stereum hirsutum FP-91666 SS1]
MTGKKSWQASLPRTLFSCCFSECCMMFVMLMCQGLGVFSTVTRFGSWQASLIILLSIILVLIPLSLSFILTSVVGTNSSVLLSLSRLSLSLVPLLLYFLLLSYIPLPAALFDAPSPSFFSNIITPALARLTILGTIILGALSGFGAVSASWGYFPFGWGKRGKIPTESDIDIATRSLERVELDIERKKKDIEREERKEMENKTNGNSSSWLSRAASSIRGDNELANLNTELSSLHDLQLSMSTRLSSLRARRAEVAYEKTWVGRVSVLGQRGMGLYCVFRGFSSIFNILLPTRPSSPDDSTPISYPDILTHILITLFPSLSSSDSFLSAANITSVMRQLNLLLVGVIIAGSVRRVLKGVARALKLSGNGVGIGGRKEREKVGQIVILVLGEVMGIYLLSTLIQLRTSFPPPAVPAIRIPTGEVDPSQGEITNLFSTLPAYEIFGPVFDWSFLLSVVLAAGGEWVRERFMGGGGDDD